MNAMCSNLQVKRPTAERYLDVLEAAHLVRRLAPFGYGKEVLRGRFKTYLTAPAIAPALCMVGRTATERAAKLGVLVESAVVSHLVASRDAYVARCSYWRDRSGREVDIIVEAEGRMIPFEVKYRSDRVSPADIKGLRFLCKERKADYAYVITRSGQFGLMDPPAAEGVKCLQIPAPLACYWIGGAYGEMVESIRIPY